MELKGKTELRVFYILLLCSGFIFNNCSKEVFVEPKEDITTYNWAKITIDSYPPGATIYVDGRTTGYSTPFTIENLAPGKHTFKLKMEYSRDTSLTAQVSLENTDSILVDYSKNPLMLGKIICNTLPPGILIYLNGVNTGRRTPYTFTDLFPKEYIIRYASTGFWDEKDTIKLHSSTTERSYIEMNDSLDILQFNVKNSPMFRADDDTVTVITCLGEDINGNVWLGTNKEKGLFKYDGKKFYSNRYNYSNTDFVKSDLITDIRNDADNNLWFCFSNGPEKYNNQNWSYFNTGMTEGLGINGKNVAISTERSGLITYKDGIFNHYLPGNSGIKSGEIKAACFDKEGKVWVSLKNNAGINVCDGNTWRLLDTVKGEVPTNYFLDLQADPDGNLIGVYPKRVSNKMFFIVARYENGVWNKVNEFAENGRLYVDLDKKLWFGKYRFMDKNNYEDIISIVNWQKIRRLPFLISAQLLLTGNTFIDSKGNLWLYGMDDMLLKIKPGRWKR